MPIIIQPHLLRVTINYVVDSVPPEPSIFTIEVKADSELQAVSLVSTLMQGPTATDKYANGRIVLTISVEYLGVSKSF